MIEVRKGSAPVRHAVCVLPVCYTLVMRLGIGTAPGKVILFGEHAVVYGRPALAAPVTQVCATAIVRPGQPGDGLVIQALDLGQRICLREAGQPLAVAAGLALEWLDMDEPDWVVEVSSTIPIASGLGSGAAVSVAILRAMFAAAERELPPEQASALAFQVEQLHHGTPSGVDNTVVAYGQPVYFVRGQRPEPFTIGRPFMLAIGDTGIASPTRVAVSDVRARAGAEPEHYKDLFDRVGGIVAEARWEIEHGKPDALGPLMDANHALLQEIGVSSAELDRLVAAARATGAGGAKLCGGGRGGNMIALVSPDTSEAVAEALHSAGAVRVIVTGIA
jgi:mevalonate kinase